MSESKPKSKTPETAKTVEGAHKAHAEWHKEHAAWLDDVELWLAEYARAVTDLQAIAERVKGFMRPVEEHAATINVHEEGLTKHEHELVGLHCLSIEEHDIHGPAHRRWGAKHAAEREEHERLKAKVHELGALIRKLDAATLAGPRST